MRQVSLTGGRYKIGELAEELDVATSALRFWESEFEQVQPSRTAKGQRVYSDQDLALLRRIKFLLHEQGMTIEGAKRALAEPEQVVESDNPALAKPELLRQMVTELEDIRKLLQS